MASTASAGAAACAFHFKIMGWGRGVSVSDRSEIGGVVWEDKIVVGRWLVLSVRVAFALIRAELGIVRWMNGRTLGYV